MSVCLSVCPCRSVHLECSSVHCLQPWMQLSHSASPSQEQSPTPAALLSSSAIRSIVSHLVSPLHASALQSFLASSSFDFHARLTSTLPRTDKLLPTLLASDRVHSFSYSWRTIRRGVMTNGEGGAVLLNGGGDICRRRTRCHETKHGFLRAIHVLCFINRRWINIATEKKWCYPSPAGFIH